MRSLRIAHIADTHLGYKYSVLPDRDEDFMKSWLYACRDIVNSSPDLILHAGDVFHSHRPDWKALTAFSRGLDILQEAQVPILIIAGNHDTSGISSLHTVFTFTSNLYPHIISTNDYYPSTHYLAALDVEVVLVPHRSLLNPQLSEHIQDIVSRRQGYFSILVSHGSISKEDPPSEPGSVAIPHSITEHQWDYMAFGHLHLSQPYGQKGWYSGSTERCGWSDLPAAPAWTLVELDEDKSIRHTQKSVPHMQFIDLPDLDCEGLSPAATCSEIVRVLEGYTVPEDRCHIRVKVLNLATSAKRPVEFMVRKVLRKDHPLAFVSINLDTPQYSFFEDSKTITRSELKPIPELFKDFVADRQYDADRFRDMFLERGLELLSRKDENEMSNEES